MVGTVRQEHLCSWKGNSQGTMPYGAVSRTWGNSTQTLWVSGKFGFYFECCESHLKVLIRDVIRPYLYFKILCFKFFAISPSLFIYLSIYLYLYLHLSIYLSIYLYVYFLQHSTRIAVLVFVEKEFFLIGLYSMVSILKSVQKTIG
jgi:hypothetical protein